MAKHTTLDRRAITTYWAAVAFVLLIATAGAVTLIVRDYNNRIDSAGQNAISLAKTLAEHTTQIFVKLEALSRAVTEDRSAPIVAESMLSEVMVRRAAAEPAADAIALVDKAGRVIASSARTVPVGKDLSATPAFKLLSTPAAPQSFIGRPYRTETVQRGDWSGWTIDYTRRIENDHGVFDGMVLIVVDGPFLYGFYNELQQEDERVVGIVGEDGMIRASNVTQVIGSNIRPQIEQEIKQGGGIQIASSIPAGTERIFAYSKSSAAPLLTYVGTPTRPIYRAWMISSGIVAAALSALAGALVALGILLGKYVRSRKTLLDSMLETARERQEREFLQAILNTGGALVVVTDARGHFVVANPAFRELFAVGDADKTNQTTLETALGCSLDKALDDLPHQVTANVLSRTGEKRELSWTLTPIRGYDDTIKNLVAIGFDNTERREAELAIYQSGKLITLGEMATGIAHEINQPLGTIGMAVDNLRERIRAGKAKSDFIESSLLLISEQVDRTAAIVDHMRIFGRRSDGKPYPLDPAAAVEGALTIAQAQLTQAGIRLCKNYVIGAHKVLAEITRVEQMILNILLNARDAILEARSNNEHGPSDWIEIEVAAADDDMVAVTISDSGPGIAPEVLNRIFEPFFTTKPVGGGTGLGLALSYGMARDFGGRIEARNSHGGAVFAIVLPSV